MTEGPRSLWINGAPRATDAGTVSAVLAELGIGAERAGVAVALDGAIVARRAWPDTPVAHGQRLEIITAQAGG
jgi:thiamine biosynthesis protein ThiS